MCNLKIQYKDVFMLLTNLSTSLFFFALMLFSLPAFSQKKPDPKATSTTASTAPEPEDIIVATVNGRNITLDQLQESFAAKLLQPSNKKISPESVLNNLIDRDVAVENAYKEGLDKDPFVQERFKDLLQSTYVTKTLGDEVSELQVTDKEVEKYYKNHKEMRTSNILIRIQAVPSPQELKEAFEKIESIYEEANKKPEKFEELAKNHSQIANRDNGGDMGFLPAASFAPEYFEAINGKSVGYITPPIRTQFGYHIVKVTGIKDFKDINKDMYKKILFDQKRDAMVEDLFKSLKKKASVKIFKDKIKM